MEPNPHSPPAPSLEEERPDPFNALLVGAAVACVASFLPYCGLTIIGPPGLGAITAVWWRSRRQKVFIPIGKAALLAFGASLLGGLCYIAIYDLLWIYFDYRHGAREEEAAALAFSEWLGGTEARQAAEEELIRSRYFSMSQLIMQILGILVVSGLIAPAVGAFTAFLVKPAGNRNT